MIGQGPGAARRPRALAAIASIVMVVAACGSQLPSPDASSKPRGSAEASLPPSGTATPSASTSSRSPSAAPSATELLGRVPLGRVSAGRFVGSPEGEFLGAITLGRYGAPTPLDLPSSSMGFAGAWSANRGLLLVTTYNGKRLVVGTYDLAAATFSELHPKGLEGEVDCSAWHPTGTSVICTLSGRDPADDGIFRIEVSTGAATRLTTSPFHHVVGTAGECGGNEGRAVYSPDGSRFAFVQQRCGSGANPSGDEQGALAVANADGSSVNVIVPFGGVRTHPGGEISWSPQADLIAFGTQDGKLSVVRPDGTGLRTIDLPIPGFVYGPVWSPDAQLLLVTLVLQATGQADLFIVAADGSTMSRVTDTAEVEAYTDWSAIP